MKYSLLLSFILSVFLAGCATTQPSMSVNPLELKIAHIEEKTDDQDQEITALRYDVENISDQLKNIKRHRTPPRTPIPTQKSVKYKGNRLIRVSVSPEKIQTALKNAGYYDGTIDGKIGKKSKKAITEFQRDHNLKADCIVGGKTWAEMRKYLD